jgi:hypothetical protein
MSVSDKIGISREGSVPSLFANMFWLDLSAMSTLLGGVLLHYPNVLASIGRNRGAPEMVRSPPDSSSTSAGPSEYFIRLDY